MTREQQKKLKELQKTLPKMLKEKIKIYKLKKKDFMIWYSRKDLFFDALIDVRVKDNQCLCTTKETIKPLWLDDLLWNFLGMENNKKESLSLRSIGAFTVSGSVLFEDQRELINWTLEELEVIVDSYLEHFYQTVQTSTIDDYLQYIKTSLYHIELRKALTYIHHQQYQEALDYLKDFDEGCYRNGDISINNAMRDYCKQQLIK